VLSVPYALRLILAQRADVLRAVARIFYEVVSRAYLEAGGTSKAATGAVTFVQRFGSLSLNVHLHVIFADGVFVRDELRGVEFRAASLPDRSTIGAIAMHVAKRVARMLRRKGLVTPNEIDGDLPDAITSCGQLAIQHGAIASVDERGRVIPLDEARDDRRFGRTKSDTFASESDGFDVHAGVFVPAQDRDGRERLFRYGARPAVSLSRMSRLPDGRIAYRMKHPGPYGHTHRVVTPQQFLARVAALIPPPKYPLVRYHGVFAPNSRWRKDVVPPREIPRTRVRPCKAPDAAVSPRMNAPPLDTDAIVLRPRARTARPGGERIDWATLLRRTYAIDAMSCPCGANLRVVATITEPGVIAKVLQHVGEPIAGDGGTRFVPEWDPAPPEW
jgi:hypothetical protein